MNYLTIAKVDVLFCPVAFNMHSTVDCPLILLSFFSV